MRCWKGKCKENEVQITQNCSFTWTNGTFGNYTKIADVFLLLALAMCVYPWVSPTLSQACRLIIGSKNCWVITWCGSFTANNILYGPIMTLHFPFSFFSLFFVRLSLEHNDCCSVSSELQDKSAVTIIRIYVRLRLDRLDQTLLIPQQGN